MSTQAIGSGGYTNAYSLLRAANEEEQLVAQAKKVDQEAKASGTAMGNDIMSYLDKVPKGSDGKLSFQEVDDYRTTLEEEWDAAVMADLKKLGVDVSTKIPLTYDTTTGKVTVASGNEDKAVIDQYFENNPDKVEDFNTILQLGKLTTTASTQLTQASFMQSLQQESLAWWYEDNSDPTDWFSGGGMLTGTGQSSYTGLNLLV
ncbi:hypothetical protein [Pseudodesulfovibrio sediminis]|uniref:EF-hand domain-containing protein n=1 Tax=Pseudodesulfovibrio sediminis TaxID=2810563 RepID=A0ABN6EVL7_9BACT|nr:hypothetical protein [Pseudodesulfovibrio sediminis]BCS89505.1 hypothetical protein PSDVSF_27470 [Pseudodesulfovibrio sediminis]